MSRALCIHGHFYQPPRMSPWLGDILPEPSAAPELNWNARIIQESYLPLGWAKRYAGDKISEMINAYEWISFNFGPTLLSYLERSFPRVYKRVLEADALSQKRLGHGNALAQIYHHVIMPLASPLDKKAEVSWAVTDFAARFGRAPEGIWLAETAVDTATLEVLAEAGLKFTILAPGQALAVGRAGSDQQQLVDEGSLDISQPYTVELPSGQSLAVFFYHGALSRAVAFEKLLADGERFYQRLNGRAGSGLLSLATDGETYGHHFPFGEMALAYVLDQARSGRDGFELTNYATYLEKNPPKQKVWIKEPSSWSCLHGVERWRSDCGCTNGDHPAWNQKWRAPLRNGLDAFKEQVDKHYFTAGAKIFKNPEAALLDWGQVLAGRQSQTKFAKQHGLAGQTLDTGLALLAMQQWALSSFASCAWFFDDISRLEPLNAMTFALRAGELAESTNGPDVLRPLLERLKQAVSNDPAKGTGNDIFRHEVMARQENPATLIMQALLKIWATRTGESDAGQYDQRWIITWPDLSITIQARNEDAGTGQILWSHAKQPLSYDWTVSGREASLDQTWPTEIIVQATASPKGEKYRCALARLAWNKQQDLSITYLHQAATSVWQRQMSLAAPMAGFFLPWQEAQQTQPREEDWLAFWPALLMTHVSGHLSQTSADFLRFLKEHAPQPTPSYLKQQLQTFLLGCLGKSAIGQFGAQAGREEDAPSRPPAGRPDFDLARAALQRLSELDIRLDLYDLQTALWDMRPWGEQASTLAELIGFEVKRHIP